MPKKHIQYDAKSRRILSISDGLNKGPFEQKELMITSTIINKMTGGFYNSFYKGNKIVLEKNNRMMALEEKQSNKDIVQKIKSGKNTPEELGDLLEKII